MSPTEPTKPSIVGPSFLQLDLPRGMAQPALWRWIVGTVVAIAASLLVCWALAKLASAADPNLASYAHFQFSDYSRLTVIGVVGACVGWPIVTWLTASGRRLYLWAAIAAVVVSLAPDAWILYLGQPAGGVATLALMHIGLGAATYLSMVFIAPQRKSRAHRGVV